MGGVGYHSKCQGHLGSKNSFKAKWDVRENLEAFVHLFRKKR